MSSHESSCEALGLKPLDDALHELLSANTPLERSETIPSYLAHDRILSADVISTLDVPSFNNSAMDGYALCLEGDESQAGDVFKQVGQAFAGQPFQRQVESGQCIRIMTGAQVPVQCTAVVMQEQCETQTQDGDITVTLQNTVKEGNNIRLRGNDIKQGDKVLCKGQRLNPAKLGVLASLGIANVRVFNPLTVALFASGDELKAPGEPLGAGSIYESNRFVVEGMLRRLGINVLNLGIVEDDPAALKNTFLKAAEQADAIVCSGGVSVGEADYTKDVLEAVGKVDMWKLAIKPGKPFAFGNVQGKPFFGLPGNPSSAAITFHQLALPCLRKLSGETATDQPLSLRMTSPQNIRKRPGRTDFQRGWLHRATDGNLEIQVFGQQSSGMLSTLAAANCYIKIEQERGNVLTGEEIEVIPFDRWLV